ncbi:polypeptide N-acetylgalactosaminyltransferase 15-like [Polypterus senegalus]
MPRRKRCRLMVCRLRCVALTAPLALFVMLVTLLDPLSTKYEEDEHEFYEHVSPRFVDLEEILQDEVHMDKDGLSSWSSFREDQLLVVHSDGKLSTQDGKRGNYKMVKTAVQRKGDSRVLTIGKPTTPKHVTVHELGAESPARRLRVREVPNDRLSFRRKLPDLRHTLCPVNHDISKLPTASIIICFHNEALSTLLRTVYSILETVPKSLLQEIILVDDLSQQAYLKTTLSEYISRLERVKLIRSNKRVGVIGGRLLGAARASGDVLVFMDSHCECPRGWLEPLLTQIADDRHRVVAPVLDVIDLKSFQYLQMIDQQRGVIDWNLDFHWEPLPVSQMEKERSPISPIRSPILPGGVLAIDRHYFQNIGAYDPDLSIWGLENVELSIRVWLCGGSLEILPCSRVGRLNNENVFDALPDERTLLRNKVRVVETWLDSFKQIFYMRDTAAYLASKAEDTNSTERLNLRRRLECKNFDWFLKNIYPELYIPQDRPGYSGQLFNVGTGYCADVKTTWDATESLVQLSTCTGNGRQHCEYNNMKEIRCGSSGQKCFDVKEEKVILTNCTSEEKTQQRQQWDVQKDGHIFHIVSEKCLEVVDSSGVKGLFLHQCSQAASQQWRFEQLVFTTKG